MTTVSELKTMYVKLGGSLEDVANVQTDAEMIDKIEDIMGSKILPDASEADNGDVLTVDDGAWAIGTIPTELPNVTADDNGDVLKVVEGAWAKGEIPTPEPELPTVTSADNGDILKVVDGAWAKGEETKELPNVTSSDNNKVLAVSNGAWTKKGIFTKSTFTKVNNNSTASELTFDLGFDNNIYLGYGITDETTRQLLNMKTIASADYHFVPMSSVNTKTLTLKLDTGNFPTGTYKIDVYFLNAF